MAPNRADVKKLDTKRTVSPRLVNKAFSTMDFEAKKKHSESFFKSLKNRKTKIKNAKTA